MPLYFFSSQRANRLPVTISSAGRDSVASMAAWRCVRGWRSRKHGPQLARLGDGAERGAVERLVRFVSVGEDFGRQGRRHETEQFV